MQARRFVVAATGLRAEARIAERSPGVTAVAGGGNETRLAELLEGAIAGGASGVISFGIAGALQPGLLPGVCIIGAAVVCGSDRFATDAAWANRLMALLPDARREAVAGSVTAVADVEAKARLYQETGAVAVDMESQVVARVATAHRLPFAVLRVIADSADQRLPPAAVNGMKPDGTPDIPGVLKSLALQPAQLPDLIRTAFVARRAMAELLRRHRLVGAGLGGVDFL